MCIQIFFWKINSCKKNNKNTNYKHSKCYLIFCYLAIKLYCNVSLGKPVCPMQCEKNILFQQVQFSSVQFSSLTNWVIRRTEEWFSRDPLPVSTAGSHWWAVLALARMYTLWHCLSGISSADHSIAHPPRRPEGWFWRGCPGTCPA